MLAEHADADQLDAAEQQHRRHQRGIAGQIDCQEERARNDPGPMRQGKQRDHQAEPARQAQRRSAEAGEAFKGQRPTGPSREGRAPAGARLDVEVDEGVLEADPGVQAFHEAAPLGQLLQRVDHAEIHQPEVVCVVGDGLLGNPVVQRI